MATTSRTGGSGETRSKFNEQVKELVSRLQQEVSRTAVSTPGSSTRSSRQEAKEPSSLAQVGRAVVPSEARLPVPPTQVNSSRIPAAVSRVVQPSSVARSIYSDRTEANMVSSVANGKTKVWDTDWVTLFGASGATYVRFYAPQAEYLDAGSYTNLTLRVSMPGVTNIGLVLQHSNTLEGYFRNVYGDEEQQLYGTTTMMLILSSEGGDRQFSRYLRWGLSLEDETGAPQWRACFRIEAFV